MLSKADVKLIRSLDKKKNRRLNHFYVIEGKRLVHDAVIYNCKIYRILMTDVFLSKQENENILNQISEHSIKSETVSEKEMSSISGTVTPSGILALCSLPKQEQLNVNNSYNWLYLDTIQDPGNLGTLLRSATWFGINNIALSDNCIDVYNPKVLRSGMGAHFNLNIYENISLESFENHVKIGAFQEGDSIHKINSKNLKPWVLVIGNEAHGIRDEIGKIVDTKITIPKIGIGESINAAIAGSILLYHLTAPLLSDQ